MRGFSGQQWSLWAERLLFEGLKLFSGEIRSRSREPLFLRMLLAGLRKGGTLIEVGSSDGCESLVAIRSGRCDLSVIAEPDPRNIAVARQMLRRTVVRQDKVRFFEGGVADTSRRQPFYLHPKHANLNSAMSTVPGAALVEVEYLSLADLIARFALAPPLLVKMDIEGYEVEVLRGAMDYLLANVGIGLLIELHPERYDERHSLEAVLQPLLDAGFRFSLVESAGETRPAPFAAHGLRPFLTSGTRGLYRNLAPDVGLGLSCWLYTDPDGKPRKAVRSILLERPMT